MEWRGEGNRGRDAYEVTSLGTVVREGTIYKVTFEHRSEWGEKISQGALGEDSRQNPAKMPLWLPRRK